MFVVVTIRTFSLIVLPKCFIFPDNSIAALNATGECAIPHFVPICLWVMSLPL